MICATGMVAAGSSIVPIMDTNGTNKKTGGTDGHVADVDTTDTFEDALGLFTSSRYAGRIWSDKSVFTGGVTVNGTNIANDSDFLHVFSALGSSLMTSRANQIPLDVVFILDTSYSMVSEGAVYGGKANNNRLAMAAKALNEAVALVMDANPENRVGLVEFNSDSYEVMSLGRYTPNGSYFSYTTDFGREAAYGRIGGININASAVADSGANIDNMRKATVRYGLDAQELDDVRLTPLRPDNANGYGTNYAYGMTNTQAGLYKGMKMLENADLGDGKEQRLPIVVLITDGHPTRSLASNEKSSWWDPSGESTRGETGLNSATSYYGHGILALATASYMKAKISEHYFGEGNFTGKPSENPYYKTQVFTFGLETNVLTEDDAQLAATVMNPGKGLTANNNIANNINSAWSDLCGGTEQKVLVERTYGLFGAVTGYYYTTMQLWTSDPDNAYISLMSKSDAVTALNYVDEFVNVTNAGQLPNELSRVLTFVKETAPWLPVAGENDLQEAGGDRLTYIDPIGKYMTVKSVKNLLLFGTLYSLKEGDKTTDSVTGVTRQYYTVEGAVWKDGLEGRPRPAGQAEYADPPSTSSVPGDTFKDDSITDRTSMSDSGNTTDPPKLSTEGRYPYPTRYTRTETEHGSAFETETETRTVTRVEEFSDGTARYRRTLTGTAVSTRTRTGEGERTRTKTIERWYEPLDRDWDNVEWSDWSDWTNYTEWSDWSDWSIVWTTGAWEEWGYDTTSDDPHWIAEGEPLWEKGKSYHEVGVQNPCYGTWNGGVNDSTVEFKLSDIVIYLETTWDFEDPNVGNSSIESDAGYDRALYINIPAAALPVWIVSVDEKNNNEITYTTNRDDRGHSTDAYPMRVFYTVGMADEVLTGGKVDLTKVDPDYLNDNKDPDNSTVYFYSNWYKERFYNYILTKEYTYGDPVMSFSPAEDNRYYIFQKNLTVYTENPDGTGSETQGTEGYSGTRYPVTSVESDKWYYIVIDYYTPSGYQEIAVPRIGSMFGSGFISGDEGFGAYLNWVDTTGKSDPVDYVKGSSAPDDSGNWVIATKIGGVRTGNMSKNVQSKNDSDRILYKDNTVDPNTAGTYYLPTISRDSGSESHGIVVNNYMGNNGRLSVTDTQVLVTKTVQGQDPGVDDGDGGTKPTEFQFTIKLMAGDKPVYVSQTVPAILVTRHPTEDNKWRARADTIELFTNSQGMLLGVDGKLAKYDGNYVFLKDVKPNGNDYTGTVFDSNGGENYLSDTDETAIMAEAYLVSIDAYDDSADYRENPPGEPVSIKVGIIDWGTAIGHEVKLDYKGKITYLTTNVPFDENGVGEFTLRHGDGLLFNNLDPDVTYTVKEILTKEQLDGNWAFMNVTGSHTGDPTESAEGTNGDGKGYAVTDTTSVNRVTSEEHYFNRNVKNTGELKIEKIIYKVTEDLLGDTFTFLVTLTLPDEYNNEMDTENLPNAFPYTGYKIDGAAFNESVTAPSDRTLVLDNTKWEKNSDGRWYSSGTVTLSHGQGILIKDLPCGTDFVVTETVPKGYRLKFSTGTTGTIPEPDTVPVAHFENEKFLDLPGTGGTGTAWYAPFGFMLLLSAAVFLAIKRIGGMVND